MQRKFIFSLLVLFSLQLSFAGMSNNGNGDGEGDIVKVSWYGGKFHGRKTASGQIYNMNALTAAHKTLPFGTKVRITNIKNNKSVVVVINDRGPYVGNRKFDLSRAAFKKIASHSAGVISVKYDIL